MKLRLTQAQRAQLADCICPLPEGMPRKHPVQWRVLVLPVLIFAGIVGLVALFSPTGAYWLLGIAGVLAVCSIIVRLARGHTLLCSLVWGPVAALYWIGEGIASATP